jgi:argininosuccinate lyase
MLGVAVSRFTTDLMFWAGAGTGFVDLPDDWSGISSAMPQKKNFPILERIRGRCARLAAAHMSVLMAQRNTPYSNSVEVSKEAGADVPAAFEAAESVLRLFTAVLEVLRFRADRMRSACRADYLGGFTLANLLTLRAQVPWRTAQVVAGRYIVAATDRGLAPHEPDPALLVRVAAEQGHPLAGALELLTEAFDVDAALAAKRTSGSTDPSRVRELLRDQEAQLGALAVRFADRAQHTERGAAELTADLARIAGVVGSAVPSGGGRADRR